MSHDLKIRIGFYATALLAGCSSVSLDQSPNDLNAHPNTTWRGTTPTVNRNANTMSLEQYKRQLAQHISDRNSDKVYAGSPQAMLRSVIVVKYVIDANGRLEHSDTLRSNGDSTTIASALSSLRNASPFPSPPNHLLHHGKMEVIETMLFNDDGRFQLRSIASAQLNE